jgi:exodeoxyribonuclease VIII
MAIHGMIDLETLSTRPDAVILSLGAVKFNPYNQEDPYDPLYFKVDVDSQTEKGRHVMQETLDWWATQPKHIQEDALGEQDRISLDEVIKQLNKWSVGIDVFWCQGPLFDYAILQNFYAQMQRPVPWQYWAIRDSRTLFGLFKENEVHKTDAHNALADCDYQAKKVQRYYKALGIKQ